MTQLTRNRAPGFGSQLCVSKGLKTETLPLHEVCQVFGSSLEEGITVCAWRAAAKPNTSTLATTLTWQEAPTT